MCLTLTANLGILIKWSQQDLAGNFLFWVLVLVSFLISFWKEQAKPSIIQDVPHWTSPYHELKTYTPPLSLKHKHISIPPVPPVFAKDYKISLLTNWASESSFPALERGSGMLLPQKWHCLAWVMLCKSSKEMRGSLCWWLCWHYCEHGIWCLGMSVAHHPGTTPLAQLTFESRGWAWRSLPAWPSAMHGCCETWRRPSHLCILQDFCCFKTTLSKAVEEKQNKTALNKDINSRQEPAIASPTKLCIPKCCSSQLLPSAWLSLLFSPVAERPEDTSVLPLSSPHSHPLVPVSMLPLLGKKRGGFYSGSFHKSSLQHHSKGKSKCNVGRRQNQLSTRKPAPALLLTGRKPLSTAQDHPRTTSSPIFGQSRC